MSILVTSILGLGKNASGMFMSLMKMKVEDRFAKTSACLFSSWEIYWILKSSIFITRDFTSSKHATIRRSFVGNPLELGSPQAESH